MKKKLTIQLIMAVVVVTFGLVLLTVGFLCPPLAIIDTSVLTASGEVLTFAGSLLGLDYNYKYKMHIHTHGNESNDNVER